MARQRLIKNLALIASLLALAVITLGAFTRLIDAGLGCPDWPGCYGHVTVPVTSKARTIAAMLYPSTRFIAYKAWSEMIHRYLAGSLSLFILAVVIIVLRRPTERIINTILALLLIALVCYQIVLGQWTVTLKLMPIIVSQHLLGGFTILATLWLLALLNNQNMIPNKGNPLTKALIPWAALALILVIFQIALGAWTSTTYASLSCPDFPFCVNQRPFFPTYFKEAFSLWSPLGINYDGGVLTVAVRQTIQMSHRFGALVVTIYLLLLSMVSMHRLQTTPKLLSSIYLILGLLIVQLSLGIANVLFKLPLVPAVLHTVVAALLLLSVLTFLYKLILFAKVSQL